MKAVIIGRPQAPQRVRVSADKPAQIQVSWELNEEAQAAHLQSRTEAPGKLTLHIVRVRSIGSEPQTTLEQDVLMPESTSVFAVDPGVEYLASVEACNHLEECTMTSAAASVLPLSLPSPPTGVLVLRRSSEELVITWDEAADVGDGQPPTVSNQDFGFRVAVFAGQTDCTQNECNAITRVDSPLVWRREAIISEYSIVSPGVGTFWLQVAFINRVGASQVMEQFQLEVLECEDICGDGVQSLGEDCDDGNEEGGDGCSSDCTVEAGYLCKPSTQPDYDCSPDEAGISQLLGASDCRIPSFLSIRVSELSTLPGANNQLLVSFEANFALSPMTTLTLEGLTGSQSPDDESLSIDALRKGLITRGKWSASAGRLVFTLLGDVSSNELVSFRFTLKNPAGSQAAVTVTVSCDKCSEDRSLQVTTAQHQGAVLGVELVPPLCADPGRFGSSCQFTCHAEGGVVEGDSCVCLPYYFGYDCSVYAQPDPERSLVEEVRLGVRTAVGSLSASRRRASVFPGTRLAIDIPADALSESLLVIANVYSIQATLQPGSRLVPLSDICELRPDGVSFAAPVSLSFSMDPAAVANASNATKHGLQLHVMFYDTGARVWRAADSFSQLAYDSGSSTSYLTATTTHFSLWSVFGEPVTVTTTTAPVATTPAPPPQKAIELVTTTPEPAAPAELDINLIVGVSVGASAGLACCFVCGICLWRRQMASRKEKALEAELSRRRKEQRDEERQRDQVRRNGTVRAEEETGEQASGDLAGQQGEEAAPFGRCLKCGAPVSRAQSM